MKPKWENSPDWAKWLAQDSSGEWFWYGEKPVFRRGEWEPTGGSVGYAGWSDYELQPEPRP